VNFSTNCGIEGASDDPVVLDCRRRLVRAMLATLFVTQGLPMLQAGDELGRTQRGNNNAYCQDGELSWIDWTGADRELADFVAGLAALRRRHAALRRRQWLTGEPGPDGRPDCRWLHPAGREMSGADWHDGALDAFGWWLGGLRGADGPAVTGTDDAIEAGGGAPSPDLACLFNRGDAEREFALPDGAWNLVCDTAAAEPFACRPIDGLIHVSGRAVVLLEQSH
jgi:glycogen operon protein